MNDLYGDQARDTNVRLHPGRRKSMRTLTICLVLILSAGTGFSVPVLADHHHKELRKSRGVQQNMTPDRIAPDAQRVGISNKRAASLVKQRYVASRILGVSLLDNNGPPIYRVRTLSPKGVVRSVFVDGNTGEVFE